MTTRRRFIRQAGALTIGSGLIGFSACNDTAKSPEQTEESTAAEETGAAAPELFFEISLAQWSLHRALKGGQLDNLDFAQKTKDLGINALEYVNQFFADKAQDMSYLGEMNKRVADLGMKNLIIMIDNEGHLGATDETERTTAVENHFKWVDAAKVLGCHSIRVNAAGTGTSEEVAGAAVDGLGRVAEYAAKEGLNVIVENHGGYSSNGAWLAGVMTQIGMDNCGTLPDFGNFCIKSGPDGCDEEYDRYQGVTELMPFAKAVSAKSHDFDKMGNESNTDFRKMLEIVRSAGYSGYIGVEYEGRNLPEEEGILATRKLLEKIGKEMGYLKG